MNPCKPSHFYTYHFGLSTNIKLRFCNIFLKVIHSSQTVVKAVSFPQTGEGEDGAAGTLQVITHSEEKLQSTLNPLGRQQQFSPADELLTC